MAKIADVTLFCNLKGSDSQYLKDYRNHQSNVKIIAKDVNVERSFINLIKSYWHGLTLNEYRNSSAELKREVARIISTVDLVVVDHYEMFHLLPTLHHPPFVLHTHNAEHVMWDRFSKLEKNLLKRLLIKAESRRIRIAEKRACIRSKLVWAAPNDLKHLEKLSPRQQLSSTYHLGNETYLNHPEIDFCKTKQSIYFFGSLNWQANLHGLLWFIDNIWPNILEKRPQTLFYIVGKKPPIKLRKKARGSKRIVFTGFVDDLESIFSQHRVFINPVQFGSGMKVKTLDAMYRGAAIVSSPVGVESIHFKHSHEGLVATTVEEWVNAVCELLERPDYCSALGQKARSTSKTHYQWLPLLTRHERELQSLISNHSNETCNVI
ncbi:MAG: glycosyltransferase [Bacteroidetes bacterium]|nr:glycosyltransferase [Bacteroidota bacterium]